MSTAFTTDEVARLAAHGGSDVVWVNGRPATSWEAQAVGHGRECERARDLAQLRGVLSGEGDRHVIREPVLGRHVMTVNVADWCMP